MAPPCEKFTTEELNFLLEFLELNPQFKFIISSESTTRLDKEAAWRIITNAFNSASQEEYSTEELRSKWNYAKHVVFNKCYHLKSRQKSWLEKLSDKDKRLLAVTRSKLAHEVNINMKSPQGSPVISSNKSPFSRNHKQESLSTKVREPSPYSECSDQNGADFMEEINLLPPPYVLSTSTIKNEVKETVSKEVPKTKDLAKERDECNNSPLPIVVVSRIETNSTSSVKNSKKRKLSSCSSKFPPIKLKTSKKTKQSSNGSNHYSSSGKAHSSEESSDLLGVLRTMNNHLSKLVSTNKETLKHLKSLDQKQDKVITLLSAALNIDDV